MNRCPSELMLEEHLLDPSRSGLARHVAACAPCGARLARMEREGEEFRRFVFPRTVDAVTAAATAPRRPRWSRWLAVALPAGGLAAAAAAMLLVVPQPPSDYLGAKGAPLSLQVWVGGDAGARAVADGGAVPAAAALRFQVRAARPCRLWLLSVDGRGEVSRLYPPRGDTGADMQTGGTLPGGAVLDGLSGPERLFAVCSPGPLPLDELERAARAAASGGDEALRRASRLTGLPEGSAQATLLLEKGP
jgi:hypothetical protein